MDFRDVDRFMQETGLAAEPAFDYLHILDEPITAKKGALDILGLYYPEAGRDSYGYVPPSTIHLPPDATYSTLLHELGHRYGHYYYNDLSEGFAEEYRKAMEASLGIVHQPVLARVARVAGEPAAQVSGYIPAAARKALDNDYDAAGTYTGDAQLAIAKVTVNLPDQLFNEAIEAQALYNEYAQQIVQQGEQPLNIQVWVDTSPTFSTDFYLVMKTTVTQAVAHAANFAQITWLAIIAALVLIAFIVAVAAYTLVHTEDFFVKAPGAAIGAGVIALGIASALVLGLAIWKGTSVKEAIVGANR